VSTKHTRHNLKKDTQTTVDHKIVILRDSHARGLTSNEKNNLDDNCSVCGFVKPGVNITTQISSMAADINLLTKNDLIIFWGGSNDVSKNNSQEGLKHLVNFVQTNNHTNIFLMCVPPRHDLPDWSCVNNEIKVFNTQLQNLMKPYKHVLIVKTDADRKFFTRHGLHMNNIGKEKIASNVSTIIKNTFQKQNVKSKSVCDNPTEGISVKSVSDNLTGGTIPLQEDSKTDQTTLESTETPIDTPNLTEDTIPLQEDSKTDQTTLENMKTPIDTPNLTEDTIPLQEDFKTDQTTLENMETPTDTPSSDEGLRTSKRKKKPLKPKVKIFYGER
jgi:hypothetical protein